MFQMFLYYDVDGIVPDMLQSSAAMMDSSRVSKYAKMTKIQTWISLWIKIKV